MSPAVVGHLAYDFGEGCGALIFGFGLGFGGEHVFYCNAGRRMGSTGGVAGEGDGVRMYAGIGGCGMPRPSNAHHGGQTGASV